MPDHDLKSMQSLQNSLFTTHALQFIAFDFVTKCRFRSSNGSLRACLHYACSSNLGSKQNAVVGQCTAFFAHFSACFDFGCGIRSTSTRDVYAFSVRVQQRNSIIICTQVSGIASFVCLPFEHCESDR